jgi:hypothetical protein
VDQNRTTNADRTNSYQKGLKMEPTKDRFDLENEILSTIHYSEMLSEIVDVMESDTREIHVDEVVEALKGISVMLGVHTDKMFDTFKQTLRLDEYRKPGWEEEKFAEEAEEISEEVEAESHEESGPLYDNLINGMNFYAFVDMVSKCQDENPEWRLGQCLMNVLASFSRELYTKVRDNQKLDCFYDDGKMYAALGFLRDEWLHYGVPEEAC